MDSTTGGAVPFWRKDGARYYPQSAYFRREFGEPIRKISIDAHFSCPNVDGTVGRGGCAFCDVASFSPSRRLGLSDINAQIDEGVLQLQRRFKVKKFIAYFQPSTNTHAPVETLRRVYETALARPEVVGLAVGTRPDAVPNETLDLLAEIAREKWVVVEFGLQSTKDATLRWLGRGHDYAAFVDATVRAKERGLRVGAHLILGLPNETRDDLLLTARRVASFGLHSVKLHHLYVARNTRLAAMWRAGDVPLPTLEEYARMVVDFLEILDPNVVVERVAGETSAEYLLAPEWTGIKHAGRNAVEKEFRARDSYQGQSFDPTWTDRNLS